MRADFRLWDGEDEVVTPQAIPLRRAAQR